MQNTNPERKSLSELIKEAGNAQIIIVGAEGLVGKHIELVEKMRLRHEVVLLSINDLNPDDAVRIRGAMEKPKPERTLDEILEEQRGGLNELIEKMLADTQRNLDRMRSDIEVEQEKPSLPTTPKIHNFGHKKQSFNKFKALPKKTLGFRGRR